MDVPVTLFLCVSVTLLKIQFIYNAPLLPEWDPTKITFLLCFLLKKNLLMTTYFIKDFLFRFSSTVNFRRADFVQKGQCHQLFWVFVFEVSWFPNFFCNIPGLLSQFSSVEYQFFLSNSRFLFLIKTTFESTSQIYFLFLNESIFFMGT